MEVWAIANQKGGVGKTTTAVTLGGLLAEQGQRVLMIDLDPHGSLSSYFGFNPDEDTKTCFDMFMNAKQLSRDFVIGLVKDLDCQGLKLISSSTALATLERKMVGQEGMGLVILSALNKIRDEFDYVLLDCPPILGVLLINALGACERILVPVQTEFLAIKGLERMMKTLKMVMNSRDKQLDYLVIPTMFDRRTQASVQSLRRLRNLYGDEVWRSSIPVDTKFRDASAKGLVPSAHAAESRGVRAYALLLKNILAKAEDLQAHG